MRYFILVWNYKFNFKSIFNTKLDIYLLLVRINDTVTFVDDGLDEDIEFGDDISDDEEADNVDNVRKYNLLNLPLFILHLKLI